jgi:hypothetical protein
MGPDSSAAGDVVASGRTTALGATSALLSDFGRAAIAAPSPRDETRALSFAWETGVRVVQANAAKTNNSRQGTILGR